MKCNWLLHAIRCVTISALALVIAPIAAWRSLVIEFAFPKSPGSRFAAVSRLWVSASLLLGAVFTLLMCQHEEEGPATAHE